MFSGSAVVPKTGGLTVGAVAAGPLGPAAFTIQDTNIDADRNGVLFDPLPPGTYSGRGPNAITVDNKGGRNGARGPGFFQVDVRLGLQVPARRQRRLEVFGEVFNLTNRANFDAPERRPALHRLPDADALRAGAVPRTAQLGARFVF